ncbi:MAG: phosphatase PAP2 family protein [Bacteroides sp.]|nr:phosphatase PAP2 family protein [Bacteroides sp.]
MRTRLIAILLMSMVSLAGLAQEIYVPVQTPLTPVQRTRFEKNIGYSTDVIYAALPTAALVGAIIVQDWEGVKQGIYTAAAAAGASYILKASVRELRPDRADYDSFPSGHSTVAFGAAAFIERRYGWKLGAPAYALATYTAVGRVLARKHYWWDVVAGAAIGVGAAYIFTTPWARDHDIMIAPGATDTMTGFTASMTF